MLYYLGPIECLRLKLDMAIMQVRCLRDRVRLAVVGETSGCSLRVCLGAYLVAAWFHAGLTRKNVTGYYVAPGAGDIYAWQPIWRPDVCNSSVRGPELPVTTLGLLQVLVCRVQ